MQIIKDLKIPLIDIHEGFLKNHKDPLSFYAHRIFGHYSPYGYSEITKFIINKVNEIN